MKRRVHIVKDTASPLWVVTCVEPCGRDGKRCQEHDGHKPVCWLGSGMNRDSIAKNWSNDPAYELIGVETLQSHARESITNEGRPVLGTPKRPSSHETCVRGLQ